VEIGNKAAQFHFWEYIIRTSVEVQCMYINEMSYTVQYISKTKNHSVHDGDEDLQCMSGGKRLAVF
jgi:hypothetical protein